MQEGAEEGEGQGGGRGHGGHAEEGDGLGGRRRRRSRAAPAVGGRRPDEVAGQERGHLVHVPGRGGDGARGQDALLQQVRRGESEI